MKPLTFTQEHMEMQVGAPWRQSLTWATRPYYPCTIAFVGIKVWTIVVPTCKVLIVNLNHFILSHQFFNLVPCEDYLGVYALHKHDTIGRKPVSITMILVGRSIVASYCTCFPPVYHISVELCPTLCNVAYCRNQLFVTEK